MLHTEENPSPGRAMKLESQILNEQNKFLTNHVEKESFEQYKEEMQDQLQNYVLTEELEDYVIEIISPHLEAVENSLKGLYAPLFEKQDARNSEISKEFTDLQIHLSGQQDRNMKNAVDLMNDRATKQDEMLDLVANEFTKDAKRKSDILIECEHLKHKVNEAIYFARAEADSSAKKQKDY